MILAASAGLLSVVWNVSVPAQSMLPVPSLYRDGEAFLSAIASEKPSQALRVPVTGILILCWLLI